jgi:hypothetical protein
MGLVRRTKRSRRYTKRGGNRTWAVVQYDDRNLNSNMSKLITRNKKYCNQHKYKHIFISSGYTDIPPYWRKVACVKDILLTNKYKGVLWLDSDASIVDFNRSLDSITDIKHSFYISGDTAEKNDPLAFNAGVWIVMNTKIGLEILTKWIDDYDSSLWKIENGEWLTLEDWAGKAYEQGSFRHHIMPDYIDYIKRFPKDFFQGLSHEIDGMFIYHRYHRNKNNIKNFLEKYPLD